MTNNNELCPSCGAPIINGQICEYCGYYASKSDVPKVSNKTYDNPVLERILDHALEIQKKHKKVIVDIMMDQHGCFGGYCIQCIYCRSGVGLGAVFKLGSPMHSDRLANLKENKLFTRRRDGYLEFVFGLDVKAATNIITKVFVEVYDVDIKSLGYHIWCHNKGSQFKDEFYDTNGNQISFRLIQKNTRHPRHTSKYLPRKYYIYSIFLSYLTIMVSVLMLEWLDGGYWIRINIISVIIMASPFLLGFAVLKK